MGLHTGRFLVNLFPLLNTVLIRQSVEYFTEIEASASYRDIIGDKMTVSR